MVGRLNCSVCKKNAVFLSPLLCKEHFIYYFEKKVEGTIKKFGLINKKERAVVAVSGGKDSMSLLYVLNKKGYNVTALAIDEGIADYREETLETMKKFCTKNGVPYRVVSFKKEFGKTLDEIMILHKERPCSVCGVFRRYLLNKYSKGFDVLATGHNMDDEAQAILMNLIKTNISLFNRLGPVSGKMKSKKFTRRVKPFYFCSEKEIMVYSFLNNLNTGFNECPNVEFAFRLRIRDILNQISTKKPEIKRKIIDWFLKNKEEKDNSLHEEDVSECDTCGEASAKGICSACAFMKKINK